MATAQEALPQQYQVVGGQDLKAALARAERRNKIRAMLLVVPLLLFIGFTFIAPICCGDGPRRIGAFGMPLGGFGPIPGYIFFGAAMACCCIFGGAAGGTFCGGTLATGGALGLCLTGVPLSGGVLGCASC